MSSLDLHVKISGHEAFAWIKNCLENHSLLPEDEEQLRDFIISHKPKDFKNPRKPRASKKSSKERAADSYNPDLCDAMTWNDHLGAQCDHKKIEGQCFCKRHFNENEKHGATRFGIFLMEDNGNVKKDRYTHAFNDTDNKIHLWDGVERPKKTKKSSKSSDSSDSDDKPKTIRKCSLCHQTGHNKKTCPTLNQDKDNDSTSILTPVDEDETDTGAGTGLPAENTTSREAFEQARVELTNTLSVTNDTQDDLVLVPTDSQETVLIPDDNDEVLDLDEDLSHDNDESDDLKYVTFEGVDYILMEDDMTVHDEHLDEIGKWDGEKVQFNSSELAKDHRIRKFEKKASENKKD